ncbi:sigma-54-dependent Fis family transcriptional regulator [Aliikangiella marina]|uniref:Sigma-54-dependent Fis family transcriptional regulator n=1 Tax=Aliikangiella marina TaxID=1712262 RepID=A0A545TGR9_9GAMM|nr:sigma 54-interacting transcriptional regulator [Aliikangiella marina]TQV76429.1 sigma-54-dependent Fis family transcriptional regulator [Aliikangiella marina]
MEPNQTTLETKMQVAKSSLHDQHGLAISIIYHTDLSRIGERHWLSPLSGIGQTEISRLSPHFYPPQDEHSINKGRALEDPYISRKPVKIYFEHGGIKVESNQEVFINGDKNTGSLISIGQGVLINIANRVLLLIHTQKLTKHSNNLAHDFLGFSDNVTEVRGQIQKVASLDVPVLIRGESGTGKELIAKAIARNSHRNQMPFVVVNMAAITSSLAPAELFGTAKGAFTGATSSRKGYFEIANNGTLFLDEIGEAAEEIQTTLLRALETGEIQAVGSSSTRKVNVRLISATDANLESKIENESFKNPLLQRIAGYEIMLAPLRERKVDIGLLMARFLTQELDNINEKIKSETPAEVENLCRIFETFALYHWPGNVRELKNLTRQLVIDNRGEDSIVLSSKLRSKLQVGRIQRDRKRGLADSIKDLINENSASIQKHLTRRKPNAVSNDELLTAFQECEWDIQATARRLRISRASLYNRIDKHPELRRATDITQDELKQSYVNAQGDLDQMTQALRVSKSAIKRRLNEIPDLKLIKLTQSDNARF